MDLNEVEENSSFILHPSSFDEGKRLDVFLSEKIEDWSRSRLQRLIDDGDVSVNDETAKSSYKLRETDVVEVELIETSPEKFEPKNIPLEFVYEDEYLAVINKPAGMVVHPGAGNSSGTLANAIAYKFKIRNSKFKIENSLNEQSKIQNLKSKIGIVHRLDKDTSGLIVVAKNEEIHEKLSGQFRNREVYKSYIALVHGVVRGNNGKIDAPIGREKFNRTKMTVVKNGRNALSLWRVRQRFEKFTLLDVEIKTGRTHQIRVHLAFLNHPVVGDETYNEGRDNTIADVKIRQAVHDVNRFFLHAEKLSFTHPKTKEKMDFYAPLPEELANLLELIQ
ncbi:MAG: RluA family pseudouridine synthase [Acidobacteria bacterium]|jgi:23S rRNA pseudouridine1911/1915/1917 synthase|nr:RluA family pseudouridine synthase [Acidobacteriota bacterium]